jgi:hypothetical protein
VRGVWELFRYIHAFFFELLFEGQKKGQKRSIFPVIKGIFPLLNHDFEVQLIVQKMPIGLYKIPLCIALLFPKIERT